MVNDAKNKIENWLIDYNQNRPHSGINNFTPQEFHALSEEGKITENTKWSLGIRKGVRSHNQHCVWIILLNQCDKIS